ncbi:MAG: hypothetical protein ABIH63_04950 [archaeon]
MARIAVEGLENDIVPLMCKILKVGGHEVCYRHESPLINDKTPVIKKVLDSKPDIVLICNANGYLPFLKNYSETVKVPALVLTGGGPDLVDKVKEYVPQVLNVPFPEFQDFYDKINDVLASIR